MRLAPIMQAFFTDYLMTQRHASRHTIASYRDCLRLLLTFASGGTARSHPSSTSITLMRQLSATSSTTLSTSEETAYPPAMPGSSPSAHCSGSPLFVIRSMRRLSGACSPFRQSASSEGSSPS